jgi:hypothetical protein
MSIVDMENLKCPKCGKIMKKVRVNNKDRYECENSRCPVSTVFFAVIWFDASKVTKK